MERFAVKCAAVPASPTNSDKKKDIRALRLGSTSSMDSTLSNSIYRKSYPSSDTNTSFSSSSVAGSIQDDNINDQRSLTQAELEEYSRSYFGQHIFHHQKQSSYAQSEGYHSYVSSSDSSSATPFLDRLRQESELLSRSSHWSQSDLQSTTSSTIINNNKGKNTSDNNSSESTSSSETLKWHGSMSDVSVASHATNSSTVSGSASTSQLIAHSSRVRTPKRHNSESVLYMGEDQLQQILPEENQENSFKERSSRSNNRLFPVGTYPDTKTENSSTNSSPKSQTNQNWQSVADRISELERQHCNQNPQAQNQKYTFLDPSKTTRVPNPALKAFQKNAVQSYFERQQTSAKEAAAARHMNTTTSSVPNLCSQQMIGCGRPQSLPLSTTITKQTVQSRSSLPNNYAQMSNSYPCSPISSTIVIATSAQCTNVSSSVLPNSTNSSPMKILASPSYQTTFHQSVATYNIQIPMSSPTSSRSSANSINIERKEMLFDGHETMSNNSFGDLGILQLANESGVPPPPPRRDKSLMPLRRTSSASDYVSYRDQNLQKQSLSKDLLGPMVMGPIISLDDWVPERPPKNPMLRIPSPDLPPPPPAANYIEENCTFSLDEPLPPPPPELLRHMRQITDFENKGNSIANRRNSFAGSTTKKTVMRATVIESSLSPPPIVPKKPQSIEQRLHQRPLSSLSKHQPIILKPQKIILNGKIEPPPMVTPPPRKHMNNDTRVSLRKRQHNAQNPIEIVSPTANCKPIVSPPPLKPRLTINPQDLNKRSPSAQGNRLRSNSKATYLPRQTREKPTNDPDRGSYKLTLTSNEDCINQTNPFQEELLNGKCSNLPDVLPMGVKVQSVQRYGSQNSLNSNLNSNMIIPQSAPALSSSFSMKPLFHFSLNNNTRNTTSPPIPPAYNRSNSESISPKYMSQSTIDLKKTHILSNAENTKIMSAAESEQNLAETNGKLSPYAMRNEFVRKMSLDEQVNQSTAVISRPVPRKDNLPIRKDSLKENIEKITQLQSKLMSAHMSENDRIIPNLTKDSNYRNSKMDPVSPSSPSVEQSEETHNKEAVNNIILNNNNANGDVTLLTATPVIVAEISETTTAPTSNPKDDTDQTKLVQRTEIVLRLNAPTSEVASQTDDTIESSIVSAVLVELNPSVEDTFVSPVAQRVSSSNVIDVDYEKLSKELISQLSPSDQLYHILAPKLVKSSSDYVTGLYNPYVRPRIVKKDAATSIPEMSPDHRKSVDGNPDNLNGTCFPMPEQKSPVPRYTCEVTKLCNGDSGSLTKQKEELMERISQKLIILNTEQQAIAEESTANDLLGNDVAIKVTQTIRPIDASKFKCYVDDVGHITMLLLSLSGRLAKIENTLQSVTDEAEKKILETKRNRLMEQLEEAKLLKSDIDRRGIIVAKILDKHLTLEDYADYDYYINMKAKLIVDARDISDRIRISEEQLNALKDTLVQSEC